MQGEEILYKLTTKHQIFDKSEAADYAQNLTYLLQFKTHNCLAKTENNIELFSQYMNVSDFSINLLHVKSPHQAAQLIFTTNTDSLFLHFKLKGSSTYRNLTGDLISTLPNDSFQLLYSEAATYNIQFKRGLSILLSISIPLSYIYTTQQYAQLQGLLHRKLTSKEAAFRVSATFAITKRISWYINRIYKRKSTNNLFLDAQLRLYLAHILDYLEQHHEFDFADEVRSYILSNFKDSNLSVQTIAEHFAVTERTLTNRFKKKYGQSISQFYIRLRVQHAKNLLQRSELSLQDIYTLCGYSNYQSFLRVYQKYESEI